MERKYDYDCSRASEVTLKYASKLIVTKHKPGYTGIRIPFWIACFYTVRGLECHTCQHFKIPIYGLYVYML